MNKAPWSLLVVIAVAWGASSLWRGHLAAADGEVLAGLAKPGDIRMLSSETCGWCTAARRWMRSEGVVFSECFIERDAQCAADYQSRGARGTPTLVVRGQTVVGFDRARVIELFSGAAPGR